MSKYKIGEVIPPWVHPRTLRWMAEQLEAYRDSLAVGELHYENTVVSKYTGGLVTRLNTIANDIESQFRGAKS